MDRLPSVSLLQLVPESLPTFRSDVAVLFGKYLPRFGVQCHIVGMPGNGESIDQGFASVRQAEPAKARWRRELSYLLLSLRILLGADRRLYDLIQVRDMVSIGLLALLIAWFKGIPFVYWVSYPMSEDRIERAYEKIALNGGLRYRLLLLKGLIEKALLYRIVLPGARHVFVQSEAMKEWIGAHGIPLDKLTAVPMGVDTEILLSGGISKQRLPGWEGIPAIAYLGTLDRLRCLHRVVDALVIVRERNPRARLLFIGDSTTRGDAEELQDYADRMGLSEAVHITGWLPSSEAWSLLVGADVAVSFVPRSEIFDVSSPTKLLEYLALALPCVGNDNPDQVQVLSGSGAGCLTESTPEALAQGLAGILADPKAAEKKAASGPAYIDRNRSYQVLAAMVAQQYQAIVGQRASIAPVVRC
jgi:glycosyltransferase involved in cell wall biosynthesis